MLNLKYYQDINNKQLSFKIVSKNGLHTISYLHAGIDFSDFRNRIARGLTLDDNDNIILVGFQKFFNDGQLDNYDIYNEQFKNQFARISDGIYDCYEKLDGTMIILGVYKDQLITSTTSSVDNDYSNFALNYFNNLSNKQDIINYLKERNSCLVFEYTGFQNQIKVKYDYDVKFTILGEVSKDTLLDIPVENNLGFDIVKPIKLLYQQLKDIQCNSVNFECYVVKNQFGNRIKFKTDWWFNAENMNQIFFVNTLTHNVIQQLVEYYLDNKIDDLLALQNSNQYWKQLGLVSKVYNLILDLESRVSSIIAKNLELKEIGLSDIDPVVKAGVFKKLKFGSISADLYIKYVEVNK